MKLMNTIKKEKQKILQGNTIKVYVCGPTIYDRCHQGHASTLFRFDVLVRVLNLYNNNNVIFVRNITDIDDKIIKKSLEEKSSPQQIVNKYLKYFELDCLKMNLISPTYAPKVTDHLSDIIKFIEVLLKNEIAYKTKSGIYLSIQKLMEKAKEIDINCKAYDQFNLCCTETQTRIDNDELDKQHEKDFALWKFKNDYGYNSIFGKGRPGWHIECSAMSLFYLYNNENFEKPHDSIMHIHGGGSDLKYPHHTNEIAQCIGYFINQKKIIQPAEIWMHTQVIKINNEKISKSLGNFNYLENYLSDNLHADVLRFYYLNTHYSSEMEFNEEILLTQMFDAILKIRTYFFRNIYKKNYQILPNYHACFNELYDDLNTPEVIKKIFIAIQNNEPNIVYNLLNILGFFMLPNSKLSESEIDLLFQERTKLRSEKKLIEADLIRKKLFENYVDIVDDIVSSYWYYR